MTTAIPAFNDTINPLGRLKPPGNYDELVTDSVTDALPGVLGVANDFVVWASRQLGHEINPVKWLSEAVGGDWGVLLSLADVWNNLASILGGGGLVALVFKWWDIGQGAINSYRVYNALTKTIQAAVSIFEMIAADRPDKAPDTKVNVPSTPYGGPSAPGTM